MAYTKPVWHRLYKTARWLRMRDKQLTDQPLCAFCIESEEVTAADTVDHIKRHLGDENIFFDQDNLQSLCASCHDNTKRQMERGKEVIRFKADGWPA